MDVFLAYMFEDDTPMVLGIYDNEETCRKSLSKGDCYCKVELNRTYRELVDPEYIYI